MSIGNSSSNNLLGSLAEDLAEKYELELPLNTLQEFEDIGNMILREKPFRKEFVRIHIILFEIRPFLL